MNNNFGGWDSDISTDQDFFAQAEQSEVKVDKTSAEEVVKSLKEEEEVTVNPEDVKEESTEDLFAASKVDQIDTEDEVETDEVETGKVSSEKISNLSTFNFLRESGLIDYEEEEGEELTEEIASELIEDKYEETIQNRIDEKLTQLPEDAKAVVKFILSGGSLAQYVDSVSDSLYDIEDDIDLTSEKNQEYVVRTVLELEGEEEDDIDEKIDYLKDKGSLENFASKKLAKLNKYKEEKRAETLEKQTKAKRQAIIDERENKKSLSSLLQQNKDFNGISVTRKNKAELPSYVYERSVELKNGNKITQLQKELFYDVPNNEVAYAQLAILMQNRNEDGTFNFDSINKKAETKVIKEIKDKARRTNGLKGSTTHTPAKGQKPLASYFD